MSHPDSNVRLALIEAHLQQTAAQLDRIEGKLEHVDATLGEHARKLVEAEIRAELRPDASTASLATLPAGRHRQPAVILTVTAASGGGLALAVRYLLQLLS